MKLSKALLVALASLNANKMRSALTILGIVIGVAAVIAMLSIGRGVEASIEEQIQSVGTNLLFVCPGRTQQGGVFSAAGSAATLTLADAEAIAEAPSVVGVAPLVEGRVQVVYLSQNTNSALLGVMPSYLWVSNSELADGEFISDTNLTARSTVVVLGSGVADTLFGGTAGAVGQTIRLNGQPYRVIGVLASKGGTGFGSLDDRVLIPLTTAQTRLTGQRFFGASNSVNVINVQVADAGQVQGATAEISAILRERHGVVEGEEDFSIQSQEDILDASTEISDTLTLFLGGIAAISLVVGGIGIMNIMLVSVTERTREIGIRKAVGARRRDILTQFLLESATLSLMGGLIGIVAGWVASRLIGAIQLGTSGITPAVGLDIVLMATLFSVAVGLFFGVYPATRAASLNPIEALRYE
ncbi:MAG: ABC transporter permease [Chloroflexota bacterium]